MTDARALLDAYAAEDIADAPHVPLAEIAPKAFAALRAVLDLHPIGNPGVAAVAWCGGCGDVDTAPDWPCANVQAITAALTSGDTP